MCIGSFDIQLIVSAYSAGLEIRPFLHSGTAKKCAGMAHLLLAIPMNWQI